jgi:hypothetical protein
MTMPPRYSVVPHDYQPPQVAMEPSTRSAQDRTLRWRFHGTQKKRVQQPTLELLYRDTPDTHEPRSIMPNPLAELSERLLWRRQQDAKRRELTRLIRVAAQIGFKLSPEQSIEYRLLQKLAVQMETWSDRLPVGVV